MGDEKALRPLGGQPLIEHVIARIAPQVGWLAINAGPGPLGRFGLPLIADTMPGHQGPLAGLLAGLGWAAGLPGVSHLATVATDTPFLPDDLIARLRASDPAHPALARSPDGLHPTTALWPVSLGPDLAQWLAAGGSRKVQDWSSRHAPAYVAFDDADFFNVNTPEDLALAEARLTR